MCSVVIRWVRVLLVIYDECASCFAEGIAYPTCESSCAFAEHGCGSVVVSVSMQKIVVEVVVAVDDVKCGAAIFYLVVKSLVVGRKGCFCLSCDAVGMLRHVGFACRKPKLCGHACVGESGLE